MGGRYSIQVSSGALAFRLQPDSIQSTVGFSRSSSIRTLAEAAVFSIKEEQQNQELKYQPDFVRSFRIHALATSNIHILANATVSMIQQKQYIQGSGGAASRDAADSRLEYKQEHHDISRIHSALAPAGAIASPLW